ncbi:MAG: DUF1611 domain-containing protein [Drouetiella hepatica Uher 2000/2452]|jgi:uncharacterized NAD-dependent epimerase/dehydratase family protein|uniref:DUF1611 domain-containing protein n=1 Tax=Drouetiella hepatica Uher 2000/2452 TaxID=904376 RepID=A0A951UNU5_9CYAN|nr:DUF1611 domain-containing protein [Drouetiella hepatica Uher 2000/2452]
MLKPSDRLTLLMHEGTQGTKGKTGISLLRYSDNPIVAVIDQQSVGQSLTALTGIARNAPIVGSVLDTLPYQPDVLAIGIAPSGGGLPEVWRQEIKQGVAAGLSVINGLHTPMATDPELQALLQPGQWIWDVRQEPPGLSVGSGKARLLSCRRVLTIGTDMSVGKMSTSLELHRASLARGLRSRFLATGQTGLMLGHDGVALDAVRIDFAAGAVEQIVLRQGDADILHVEGQGSFINPASTATLPLMRGSQPTHLVLVHRAGQTQIHNFDHVIIPPLPKVIEMYESVATAGGAFAPVKVVGIALNTFHLEEAEARGAIAAIHQETGLPCTDVIRFGAEPILEAILI